MKQKGFIFFILLISALIIGGYIGQHVESSLLSYSISVGLNHGAPLELDLIIITLSLGVTLDLSIAQILCVLLSIFVYIPLSQKFAS